MGRREPCSWVESGAAGLPWRVVAVWQLQVVVAVVVVMAMRRGRLSWSLLAWAAWAIMHGGWHVVTDGVTHGRRMQRRRAFIRRADRPDCCRMKAWLCHRVWLGCCVRRCKASMCGSDRLRRMRPTRARSSLVLSGDGCVYRLGINVVIVFLVTGCASHDRHARTSCCWPARPGTLLAALPAHIGFIQSVDFVLVYIHIIIIVIERHICAPYLPTPIQFTLFLKLTQTVQPHLPLPLPICRVRMPGGWQDPLPIGVLCRWAS